MKQNFSLISVNSGNLINHWGMNFIQSLDPIPSMCLADAGLQEKRWAILMTNTFVIEPSELSKNT